MTLTKQIATLRRDVRELFPDEPGIVKGAGIVLGGVAVIAILLAMASPRAASLRPQPPAAFSQSGIAIAGESK